MTRSPRTVNVLLGSLVALLLLENILLVVAIVWLLGRPRLADYERQANLAAWTSVNPRHSFKQGPRGDQHQGASTPARMGMGRPVGMASLGRAVDQATLLSDFLDDMDRTFNPELLLSGRIDQQQLGVHQEAARACTSPDCPALRDYIVFARKMGRTLPALPMLGQGLPESFRSLALYLAVALLDQSLQSALRTNGQQGAEPALAAIQDSDSIQRAMEAAMDCSTMSCPEFEAYYQQVARILEAMGSEPPNLPQGEFTNVARIHDGKDHPPRMQPAQQD